MIGSFLVLTALLTSAPVPVAKDASSEIEGVLLRSSEEWNKGNVDGFLVSYATDPDILFVGVKGVLRGFAQLKEKYEKGYQKDPRGMGTLSFTELEVRPLGPEHALAVGKWNLVRKGATGPESGYFTLTFEKRAVGWRIICDHTD